MEKKEIERRFDRAGRVLSNAYSIKTYELAEKTLETDPLNIRAMDRAGLFGKGWGGSWELKKVGALTLKDLEDWSEAEVMALSNMGRTRLETLKRVMAEHGLRLHPNRPTPKVRETEDDREKREEWERRVSATADEVAEELDKKWHRDVILALWPRLQVMAADIGSPRYDRPELRNVVSLRDYVERFGKRTAGGEA